MTSDEIEVFLAGIVQATTRVRTQLQTTPLSAVTSLAPVTPSGVPGVPVIPPVAPPPIDIPPVLTGALPRLVQTSIAYKGYTRLPAGASNGHDFSFGSGRIAFDRSSKTLFSTARGGYIAEVTVPTTLGDFGTYVQGFADMTEGKMASQVGSDGVDLAGIMLIGSELYGTAMIYYDSDTTQRHGHFGRPRDLSDTGHVSDFSSVWDPVKTGYVAGHLGIVPSEWQTRLGGPAVTGQFGVPIVTRTSWGPAMFSFNPALVIASGGNQAVPANPLVYYTGDHATLGPWEGSNAKYGGAASGGGLVIVDGTRTALFFGRNGLGPFGYGDGTSDPNQAGQIAADGEVLFYDPSSTAKGQHAYPYIYQIWAYDLEEVAAVYAGTKQPWEIVPYGVWPLTLPTSEPTFTGIGGADYDPATKTLYVSQLRADQDGYSYRPYIHQLTVTIPA